jgi:TrmH family RNA methyltransferase
MVVSKNTIKYIKSMRLKKFRQKYNIFIVEGDKIAKEAVFEAPALIDAIYALPEWLNEHAHGIPESKQFAVSEKELGKISLLSTPNQVLLLMRMPEYDPQHLPLDSNLSLYLDGIQDPGNLGTILRIADWFGIQTVLCSPNCVDVYNPKVIQSTMGAFLRVSCLPYPIEEILDRYPTLPVFGAAVDGKNIFSVDKPENGLIVIGNEGNGMAAATEQLLTQRIAIPAAANSRAESLNAAVATGIICAILKQG